MAYNITLTNGQNLVTVADGTTDSAYTSLTLVGKNFAGYGAFLNENFVKLLENFANNSEPPNALQGQIWWDTSNKVLKVRNGTNWKAVSSSTASATSPVTPTVGDLWWDTANGQLKVWGGAQWVTIGPAYTATQGQTGVIADVIAETGGGQSHVIVKFYVNNVVVAVMSKDSSFTVSSLPGFTTINPGFNLSSVGNLGYYGNADNALKLGGVLAANYLRGDQASTTQFPLTINNNGGVSGALGIGLANDFTVGITSNAVNLSSTVLGKDLGLYVNVGGVSTKLLTLNGTNGTLLAGADPTDLLGIATKGYVDSTVTGPSSVALKRDGTNTITGNIFPATNSIQNFGSSSAAFGTIYATSFNGLATDSAKLGGVAAANFVRNDVTGPINAPLTITSNNGLTLGASGDFTIDVTSTPNAVNLRSNSTGKSMNLVVKVAGTPTTAASIDGSTGLISVLADPVANLGIATKQYVVNQITAGLNNPNLGAVSGNIIPNQNNILNVGSSTAKWNTMFATTFSGNASTANYADLAERFESDKPYLPGTVVELGGSAEITSVLADSSENVFGVISTQAAYLMNASAGTDATHPPIAMQGRVPVRVTGTIRKGDRLISAGGGLARAAARSEITPFNVIGRALANKTTTGEGNVEAIVKLNS